MMELQLSAWVAPLGYVAVFLLMTCNGFASLPASEGVYAAAGFLVARGELSFAGVVLAGVAGNVSGNMLLYWLGRVRGESFARSAVWRFVTRSLPPDVQIDLLKHLYQKYGSMIVFWGRNIPVIRSVISFPAGLVRMHLGRYLLATTGGCSLWAVLWTSYGKFLGTELGTFGWMSKALSLIFLGLILTWGVRYLRRKVARIGLETDAEAPP